MAPRPESVLASSLVEDFDMYPRHAVDSVHVSNLARALRAGIALPPIVVDRASRRIVDGFHRRRAAIAVGGPEATIAATWHTYPSDAEMFADAVARNATHGRRLDRQDEVRVSVLAEHYGLSTERVAAVLHVIPDRVLELRARVVIVEGDPTPIPAKAVAQHVYGETITLEQATAMRSFSGVSLRRQTEQLRDAIRAGLFDRDDPRVLEALHDLAAAILELVPQPEEEESIAMMRTTPKETV